MNPPTRRRIHRVRRRRFHRPVNPFLDGIARIFDFTGSLRTQPGNQFPHEVADQEALRSDWITVGNDFRAVMGDWERLKPVKEKSKRDGMKTRLG